MNKHFDALCCLNCDSKNFLHHLAYISAQSESGMIILLIKEEK